MEGKIVAVCSSREKGTIKKNVGEGIIRKNFGLLKDAHGNCRTHRQISLLAIEEINKMRNLGFKVKPGDFAENLTTEGISFDKVKVGSEILIENNIVLKVTQIGKECHGKCSIYYKIGKCIMPKKGIFAKVIKGGKVRTGDKIILKI